MASRPEPLNMPDTDVAIATQWLSEFGARMEAGDGEGAAACFLPDGWWRDLLALTWDLRTTCGRPAIAKRLSHHLSDAAPASFRLDEQSVSRMEPQPGLVWLQSFYHFETGSGRGRGYFRLRQDEEGVWRAWTLLTSLEELKGHEEAVGARRPKGVAHGARRTRLNWAEQRDAEREYSDRDPQVVIIGAGQAGLSLAARLKHLGVDTLLLEKNHRIGDSWRHRYHSLVLHDPVWYDHLPYLPFPPGWPVFTPKDKLADWFEHYVNVLELNAWTGASLQNATYDAAEQRWTLEITRGGEARQLRPRHVVMATGLSGLPRVPEFEGQEDFAGQLVHSSEHAGAQGWESKHAVVVGTGNSGHDIAHEFHEHGARTTMVQRSSTYVVSSENGIPALFGGLYDEDGPPTHEADLISASFPYLLVAELHKGVTSMLAEQDAELLNGLEQAGFKVDFGDDGSGLLMKYLRRGGGYYIDVGCSQLIADGRIGVRQGLEIRRLTRDGIEFEDGSQLPADIIVLATGFTSMRDRARTLLGEQAVENVGPVWGLDDEGELRGIWRRSGHPGLWFMGGNLHQSRHYSKVLALQIKAVEEGLLPAGK